MSLFPASPRPGRKEDEDGDEERRYTYNKERGRLIGDIQNWLYHGTRTASAKAICLDGIDQTLLEATNDFGPGFYCTENIQTAFDCGEMPKYEGDGKGIIMIFDTPSATCTYERLHVLEAAGEQWKNMVRYFRHGVRRGGQRARPIDDTVDVVVGLVSDPKMEYQNPQSSGDDLQYAFRKDWGNTLLEDKTKVKAAVFDIPRGPTGSADEDSDEDECDNV